MESLGPIFFLPRCRWMPLGSWVISFASPKSVFWCWWLVDLVVWLEGYVIYAYIYYHSRMQRRTPKKIGWSTSSSNFRHIHHKSQFFSSCRPTYLSSGPFEMWWNSAPWQLEEGVAEGMRLTVQDTSQLRERRCWFCCTVDGEETGGFSCSCHRD
jgi:hypothetical protein